MTKKYILLVSNIASFPIYIILGNIILTLPYLFFYREAPLRIVGSDCQLNDVDFSVSPLYLKILLYFFIAKLSIIGISLFYFKKTEKFGFKKLVIIVVLLNFIAFDFFSVVSYVMDDIFSTNSFHFFFSGAPIFFLETQIGFPRYSLIIVNAIIGMSVPYFVLKKLDFLSFANVLLYFLSLLISILIIVAVFYLYRAMI